MHVRILMSIVVLSTAPFIPASFCNISLAQSTVTEEERAVWPRTVDESVNRIVAGMSGTDKEKVKATKRSDLIRYHHGWGMGIRNGFGLWKGNKDLLTDCGVSHPDDCSVIIIEKVWDRLQTNEK